MAVTQDILRSWRAPRAVMRQHLAQGQREDRALIYLMAGCFVVFIAQWPRLMRLAQGFGLAPGQEPPEMTRLVSYELLAWLIIWPLALYALGAVVHLLAKVFGGRGSFYGARLALFWGLLASTPAALLYGLVAGLIGPGSAAQITGVIWLIGFFWITGASLKEAEWGKNV